MKKIIRITTVPRSLGGLLKGQLRFMSEHFEVVGISCDEDGLLDAIGLEEGIRVIPVEMTRRITPFKDLRAVVRLYKIFKVEKPDIVHSHTPKAGTLAMIAAKLAGVPYRLHTVAGLPLLESKGLKRKVLDFVEKFTYSCATMIYPNSFGLMEIILKNKYTLATKLKVIANGSSNGIDTNYFSPDVFTENQLDTLRHELQISEHDFIFVFIGRLVKDKGLHELIAAFKKMNSKEQNVKLLLVGSYEKHLDPLQKETELEIKNNVNILKVGWQDEVRPYFLLADVLVFPSYREGFPNVVLQSLAMQTPCIVSDINGCNEIVKDGINGIIVPVKNEEKLYEAMYSIFDNPEMHKRFSKNSRDAIVKQYKCEKVWKEIKKEYDTLLMQYVP